MKTVNTKKIILLALLISMAVILHIIESSFPFFLVPWAKLGLPNIIILFTIIYFGVYEGLIVNFTRNILGGLLTGTIFNPIFIMGIAGGIMSTVAMWLSLPLLNKKFTLVSVSVIGALVHVFTQFVVVYLFFFENINLIQTGIFVTSPWFLIFVLPTGILTGIVGNFITYRLGIIKSNQLISSFGNQKNRFFSRSAPLE